jgi:uncharacterized protein (TIGR03000 family)
VEEEPPAGAALIIVKIPAEAELWFDDQPTSARGSYRRFVSPMLAEDRPLFYNLRVRWLIKGVELTRVEKISVVAGGKITVSFLTEDGWTGVRLETLPPPQKQPSQRATLDGHGNDLSRGGHDGGHRAGDAGVRQ